MTIDRGSQEQQEQGHSREQQAARGRAIRVTKRDQGQSELAPFDGHLKRGTNNLEEVFDGEAEEVHIRV